MEVAWVSISEEGASWKCCPTLVRSSRPDNNWGVLHQSPSLAEGCSKKKSDAVVGKWWLAASSQQCTCQFYSSHGGFFGKTLHHPGVWAPLQPRFGSLQLLAFPKAKIDIERGEICECHDHTVHKLSQRHHTEDWLAPQESDCSRMQSKVSFTGSHVTSRPRNQFSRYSKRMDTFRTHLVYMWEQNDEIKVHIFLFLLHTKIF